MAKGRNAIYINGEGTYGRKKINVYCNKCKKEIDESKVEFVDICEDPQGRDLMTFVCLCGSHQQSLRFG